MLRVCVIITVCVSSSLCVCHHHCACLCVIIMLGVCVWSYIVPRFRLIRQAEDEDVCGGPATIFLSFSCLQSTKRKPETVKIKKQQTNLKLKKHHATAFPVAQWVSLGLCNRQTFALPA